MYKITYRESYPQWIDCSECEIEVNDSVVISMSGGDITSEDARVLCLDCLEKFRFALKHEHKKAILTIENRMVRGK